MFQTNSFFRFYYCPKLRKKEKCSRPYCQYNHGEQTDQCIIDYSQTNFGYDDFFTNLKPEDIDSYKPTHYSTAIQKTPTSISTSNDSSLTQIKTSSSLKIAKKTKDDLFNVDQSSTNKDKHNKMDQSIAEQAPNLPKAVQSGSGTQTRVAVGTKRKYDDIEVEGLDVHNRTNRVAHTLKYTITDLPKKKIIKKINYRQQLSERYSKTYSPNRDIKSFFSTINNKMEPSHISSVSPTVSTASPNESFIPIFEQDIKIDMRTRTKVLEKIRSELIIIKGETEDKNDLAREAQKIEYQLSIDCKGLQALYGSLATSKICSLRTGKEGKVEEINKSKDSNNMGKSFKKHYRELTIEQLSPILDELTVPKELLQKYGYSFIDEKTNLAIFPQEKNELCDFANIDLIECDRCFKRYKLPQICDDDAACRFHDGHTYLHHYHRGCKEFVYSCCHQKPCGMGCETRSRHVTKGFQFKEYRMGFVRTESRKSSPNVYAIDCEMCYTELGFEMCRVTVIDFEGAVIYDQLVKPKTPIIDHNTKYSGLEEKHFVGVTTELKDVQQYLLNIISAETFVIGHSLDSDLRVLKIIHERVIDTAHLYPHRRGLPYKRKLKNLAKDHLNKIIQNDEAGHDSSEDAITALELVKLKIQDKLNKLVM